MAEAGAGARPTRSGLVRRGADERDAVQRPCACRARTTFSSKSSTSSTMRGGSSPSSSRLSACPWKTVWVVLFCPLFVIIRGRGANFCVPRSHVLRGLRRGTCVWICRRCCKACPRAAGPCVAASSILPLPGALMSGFLRARPSLTRDAAAGLPHFADTSKRLLRHGPSDTDPRPARSFLAGELEAKSAGL
jgi:hypothetical protein